MEKPDTLFWLRTVAYVAIAGTAASLILENARPLPWLLAGIAFYAATLPMWPWVRRVTPEVWFFLLVGEAALVTAGQFVSDKPGTVMLLFFELIPVCGRLPRRYSLLCYTLFPFLACLPFLMGPDARAGWTVVVGVVPGFMAMIAFSEGFWALRSALEAKEKLIDELVEAQRRQAGPATEAPSADPDARVEHPRAEELTRRDREVLGLVSMGFSNKEIAEKLYLAEGTVKNRVSQLLDKIGARDRTQAALRAREWGVL
jgi:DNA-binding CsgD family transcriptional regulator